MLVVCYAILVAGMVMMIIVNEPDAWQAYFRDSAFRFLSEIGRASCMERV